MTLKSEVVDHVVSRVAGVVGQIEQRGQELPARVRDAQKPSLGGASARDDLRARTPVRS